jgi:hypothetical protein
MSAESKSKRCIIDWRMVTGLRGLKGSLAMPRSPETPNSKRSNVILSALKGNIIDSYITIWNILTQIKN